MRSVRIEAEDRVVRAALALLLVLAICFGAGALRAQGIRPGDQRPELGELDASSPVDLSLPPLPEASGSALPRLSQGLRVRVSRIVVEGVTAFSAEQIAQLVADYERRTLTSENLVSLRDALTKLYVEHGYITSGAVIPDQDVDGGVVRVRVIEGRLGSISIEGEDWFRADYFRDRLRRAGRAPVNVHRLEAQLQVFQRDARLRAVHGRLLPGAQRGVSDFLLRIEEARPYEVMLGFANDTPPSIGGEEGNISARFWNLLGRGDELIAGFRGGEGLRDYRVDFGLPINTYDTRVGAHARFTKGVVVEEPFDVLDVKSTASTYGIQLRQPILRGASQSLELGLIAELRDQDSKVAGFDFCTIEGALDCDVRIAVLRPFAEWIWRARDDAIALRSTLSFGLHAFGSTDNPSHADLSDERRIPVPDSRFTVWLGQLEWVHHFPSRWWGGLLVVRGTAQLSADPLLSIEKLAVGGSQTVRGYRENLLVRDSGVVVSAELRIPLMRGARNRPYLELAPFFDYGRAWDTAGSEVPDDSLASLGLGVRLSPSPGITAELYWGGRLLDAPRRGTGLQRDGISIAVRVDFFEGLLDGWPPVVPRVIWDGGGR